MADMNTRKIRLIGTYNNVAAESTPENIPDLNAKIRRCMYELLEAINIWIFRTIPDTNRAKIERYEQCPAIDIAPVYASLDYERRPPAQEVKMTERKLMFIRREGGL